MILPIMASVIFLGGCGNGDQTSPTSGENQTAPAKDDQAGAIVSSLKEMVGMGKKMMCISTVDGTETKTYIEGKKYKATITSNEIKMMSVFDGETFYSWDSKTKAGTKMTMTCMEELGKNMPKTATGVNENSEVASTDKLIENEDGKNCSETSEAVDFTIPTDVNFADQCLMMQNMIKNMPKGEVPVGFNMPTK